LEARLLDRTATACGPIRQPAVLPDCDKHATLSVRPIRFLPEPSADLPHAPGTSLADGTRLRQPCRADRGGRSPQIVLFHVTIWPRPDGVQLPISGHSSTCCARRGAMSRAYQGGGEADQASCLPGVCSCQRALLPASGDSQAARLSAGAVAQVKADNPPRPFNGGEDGFVALNRLVPGEYLPRSKNSGVSSASPRSAQFRPTAPSISRPWLFAAALVALPPTR